MLASETFYIYLVGRVVRVVILFLLSRVLLLLHHLSLLLSASPEEEEQQESDHNERDYCQTHLYIVEITMGGIMAAIKY